MISKVCLWLLCILICYSCIFDNNKSLEEPISSTASNLPTEFKRMLEAHGGLDLWKSFKTLEYSLIKDTIEERHIIDLENRKVLLTGEEWKIGYDGKEVWVSPNKAAFGKSSARFYHNLIFYFFAMPYVLADDGINYDIRDTVVYNDKVLIPIATSFNDGVGDAPDDEYIAHMDVESGRLYLLLYTVTYYSKEKGKKYNALVFDEYEEVNGLLFPAGLKGYKFENGELGDQRYYREFDDIQLSKDSKSSDFYAMPQNAEIDSLK